MRDSFLLAILFVFALAGTAGASTVTEYNFDDGPQGWDCTSLGGYLLPDPVCSLPLAAADGFSVVVFLQGDIDGSATVRAIGRGGETLCSQSLPVSNQQQTRLDLFCPSGSYSRLEVVEASGDFLLDFVRLEIASPVMPTPSPTQSTPAPTQTPTPHPPTVVPSWKDDPMVGRAVGPSVAVAYSVPLDPTPTPHPMGDCPLFVRLLSENGGVYVQPAQIKVIGIDTQHYRDVTDGYSVVRLPCADYWLSVVDLAGRSLVSPSFVTLAGSDRLDLVVVDPGPLSVADTVAINGGDSLQQKIGQAIDQRLNQSQPVPVSFEPVQLSEVEEVEPPSVDGASVPGAVAEEVSVSGLPPGAVATLAGSRGLAREVVQVPVIQSGGFSWFTLAGVLAVVALFWFVGRRVFST